VARLEEELRPLTEQLETAKKQLYFPTSALVLGQQGVYAGLDDLWLERASGQLIINCIPHKDVPHLPLSNIL